MICKDQRQRISAARPRFIDSEKMWYEGQLTNSKVGCCRAEPIGFPCNYRHDAVSRPRNVVL